MADEKYKMLADKHEWTPPVNFFFTVEFKDRIMNRTEIKASFSEVTGLGWSITIEKGGIINRQTVHCTDLILKRPLEPLTEEFTKWIEQCASRKFKYGKYYRDIIIKLHDGENNILATWSCINAYPQSYKIGDFNSMDGRILMETIELSYDRLERK